MTDHLKSPSSSESAGTPSELPVTPKSVTGASGESVSREQKPIRGGPRRVNDKNHRPNGPMTISITPVPDETK